LAPKRFLRLHNFQDRSVYATIVCCRNWSSRDGRLFFRSPATERIRISSDYIPPFGEPGSDEILSALKEATREDPGLRNRPAEEVSRNLAHDGYLESEPSPTLVAKMLEALERGEK
jgi:hypothetical protein